MAGNGTPTMRRALLGALILCAFGGLVALAVRSAPDAPAPSSVVEPTKDAPPAPRPPRVRAQTPPSAEPPPRAIRVAVTSLDGTPIVGARVELFRGPVSEVLREDLVPTTDAPKAERAVAADDDGPATFDDVGQGRWFVVATAPGFARHVLLGVMREGDEGVDAPVMLEKGSAFAGTVVDPDGAPATGVVVVLRPRSFWPNEVEALRTTTDKNGAYRFDAVEAGEHSLEYSVRPDVLVRAARVLLPSLDGYDVRMVRGATITGVVRDETTGDAVPGARVFAFRYVESRISGLSGPTTFIDVAVADHLGRFALQTWRTQCEVTYLVVDAPGYAPTPSADSDKLPPGAVADGQRFVCDLRVRRAATLSGTLVGPDGPLAGFRVRALQKGGNEEPLPAAFPWSCVTGRDGTFLVDRIPAGTAVVSVYPGDWGISAVPDQEVEFVAGEEKKLDLRVELERVRVTRRVLDSGEKPVADVVVVQRFGSTQATSRTDAEGRFTIDAVFTENATFVQLRRGPYRGTALLSREDEDGYALFPPMPAATVVAGALTRGDGAPVAGERVAVSGGMSGMHGEFFPEWAGLHETASAADGTFRVPLTSGPDQSIGVSRWGLIDRRSDDDGVYRFKALDAVRVAGRVVAADGGSPVAAGLVCFEGDTVVSRTGSDGRFAFEWSPPSVGPLVVNLDGWTSAKIDDGDGEKVVAMRRAHVVAGAVRMPDGSPARGLRVVVRPVGDTNPQPDWTTTSATDVDGRFVVPGVAAGDVEVGVFDPTHHALAGSRATAKAGGGELALVVRPAASLVVQVVDGAGEPVHSADVTARADASDLAGDVAEADGDGRVTLGLAPDATYTIRVERWEIETFEQKGVRAGAEPLRIVVKSTK